MSLVGWLRRRQRLPFRLNEGIWLQDLSEIIPWDTKIEDLKNYLGPHIKNEPDSVHITWQNHTCLGLAGDVSACRLFEQPNRGVVYKTADLKLDRFSP